MAIAGAYANRLTRLVSMAPTLAPPLLTSVAARATVSRRMLRRTATKTARAPPASAVYRNASSVAPGPSQAPMAAKSLTSPAPVAPITWPGSMTRRPTARPAAARIGVTALQPAHAATKPATVIVAVSALGIRRDRTSVTMLMAPAAAIASTAIGLESCTNAHPEHVVNLGADRSDGAHGKNCDQRGQQSVLEQILAIFFARQPPDDCNYLLHRILTAERETRTADVRPQSAFSDLRAQVTRTTIRATPVATRYC